MKLIKTTLFSAAIAIIRISSNFVSGKVIALYTGTGGVALIGSFSNFVTIVLAFASGSINTGIVKYTSEYHGDEEKLKQLFSTGFKIAISCSAFIGVFLVSTAPYLSELLNSKLFINPLRVLGITVILYTLNSLIISILNGFGQIKTYTLVNTVGSIVTLLFTIVLVYFFKITGALYAMVLAQSVVFFVTALMLVRSPWFSKDLFRQVFHFQTAKNLSHFSLMAIVTALTVPVSQLILRNMLIGVLNIDAAGKWQGMMRISDGYLAVVTMALSTYYLPKLSSLKSNIDLQKEIFSGYKIVLPVVLCGCIVVYLLRVYIINILYTPSFLTMESLFFWQLLGDFFKLSAWILSYLMLAKAMTKHFIVTEIVFSLTYVLLGYYFVATLGLKGIAIAFAINYFLYLIVMIILFRKLIFYKHV